jgi:hypothetical protein
LGESAERKRRRIARGGYTPIAMERVPKHLKPKELRASIAQKSPEVIESKAVECHKEDRGVLVNVFAAGCDWANTQENTIIYTICQLLY